MTGKENCLAKPLINVNWGPSVKQCLDPDDHCLQLYCIADLSSVSCCFEEDISSDYYSFQAGSDPRLYSYGKLITQTI